MLAFDTSKIQAGEAILGLPREINFFYFDKISMCQTKCFSA